RTLAKSRGFTNNYEWAGSIAPPGPTPAATGRTRRAEQSPYLASRSPPVHCLYCSRGVEAPAAFPAVCRTGATPAPEGGWTFPSTWRHRARQADGTGAQLQGGECLPPAPHGTLVPGAGSDRGGGRRPDAPAAGWLRAGLRGRSAARPVHRARP